MRKTAYGEFDEPMRLPNRHCGFGTKRDNKNRLSVTCSRFSVCDAALQ